MRFADSEGSWTSTAIINQPAINIKNDFPRVGEPKKLTLYDSLRQHSTAQTQSGVGVTASSLVGAWHGVFGGVRCLLATPRRDRHGCVRDAPPPIDKGGVGGSPPHRSAESRTIGAAHQSDRPSRPNDSA